MHPSTELLSQEFDRAFRGRKIFVTGHTGFKGTWLCEWLLLLGAEVTGYSMPPPTDPSLFEQSGLRSRLRHIEGDIRDAARLKHAVANASPDFVFHLAAQPLVRLSYQQPVETWETNVLGTINVLEALKGAGGERSMRGSAAAEELNPSTPQSLNPSTASPPSTRPIIAVMVTTDKVYENREWNYGYREEDPLGGYDPYSSSKGAAEIAIASWRRSYFQSAVERLKRDVATVEALSPSIARLPSRPILLASARAGNVIGGGDWALDRIVPDAMRSLESGTPIPVRNPASTRPWQHVLEPLSGYLLLASRLASSHQPLDASTAELCSAFNFGPSLDSNRSVRDLVQEILKHWSGKWIDKSDGHAPHEAGKLNLATDKACHLLGWQPRWDFEETIERTVGWYRAVIGGADAAALTRQQIAEYSAL